MVEKNNSSFCMNAFISARPFQWYKNLLLFLALIFSGNLLNLVAIKNSLIAFVTFCALSSATYVLNDFADRKKDKYHPEKKIRPIASRKIGVIGVIFLASSLVLVGFGLSLFLPSSFVLASLAYFVLSQFYTLWLKHLPFADIITISINFVIRAVAGALAIGVFVSSWLIAGVFFFAIFLLTAKRRGELLLLGKRAHLQRNVLLSYTPKTVKNLGTFSTGALVICYTLYVFLGTAKGLIFTLPIVLFSIFRYDKLVQAGHIISRKPHYAFLDLQLLFSMVLWLIVTLVVLY